MDWRVQLSVFNDVRNEVVSDSIQCDVNYFDYKGWKPWTIYFSSIASQCTRCLECFENCFEKFFNSIYSFISLNIKMHTLIGYRLEMHGKYIYYN